MQTLVKTFLSWLPLAAAVTVVCGLVYLVAQQNARLGANEIPAALAADAAAALAAGQPAAAVLPAAQVDRARSLSPFLIVYDRSGAAAATNASLRGGLPALPAGVLEYAAQHGENRVTWQPEAGLRLAAVALPVGGGPGGWVLAARSLREAERRIDLLGAQVALGWAAALAISFALAMASVWRSNAHP